MSRKPARPRERPFLTCTPVEKFERLLRDYPELTPHFVGQLDSIWCQAMKDARAARASAVGTAMREDGAQ